MTFRFALAGMVILSALTACGGRSTLIEFVREGALAGVGGAAANGSSSTGSGGGLAPSDASSSTGIDGGGSGGHAPCGGISFTPSPPLPVGTSPAALTFGDFNADGIVDLAVTNNGAGTITILIGTGGGSFQDAQNYPSGETPFDIIAADVNQDGNLDLAITHSMATSGERLSIMLGVGDGSFLPGVDYDAVAYSHSVVTGDFNGDGVGDLLVAGTNGISALYGNGDGTFQLAIDVPLGEGVQPGALVSGDFNHDNIPDVAFNFNGSGVGLLLSGENGLAFTIDDYGMDALSLAASDLNADGNLDLVVAANGGNAIASLTGNGDGTFTALSPALMIDTSAGLVASLGLADFDIDGRLDLAVAEYEANLVSIFTGDGAGDFEPALQAGTGVAPFRLVATDLNGDGAPDIAVTNQSDNTVTILFNACPQ